MPLVLEKAPRFCSYTEVLKIFSMDQNRSNNSLNNNLENNLNNNSDNNLENNLNNNLENNLNNNLENNLENLSEKEMTMRYAVIQFCSKTSDNDDLVYETILAREDQFERSFREILFPLEMAQLLNFRPDSLLMLQMCVEEIEERMSVKEMQQVLECIQRLSSA
ncbi:putative RNA polymerase III subunit C17 [Pseudoloma neurophilia]|uniref:Putative RNA polymerase III subunit C17 n=1 Tax=Pseudoloma neurophilia TaxID=146866 RepID=A0A0R0M044_9MICR|nr:putative RNA polymerase III subunit C17 [Pseudoloma neurophilia]